MTVLRTGAAGAALLIAAAGVPAHAETFNRIATFHVVDNLPADADPEESTVAEIVAATSDGMTLIYTDSPGKRIGFVDIADPRTPRAAGTAALDGEPTSVAVAGGNALVGVVTSESKDKPSGHVAVVNVATKAVTARCDLGGQPDSVARSADGKYLAVVIENERDEEVNDGVIPQLPGGNLTVLPLLDGVPDCAAKVVVDLSGLAAVAPEDPEPELVDINAANQAVVSLQENNHIAIVDLATGKITANFSAGAVDLAGIDTGKDGVIALTGSATGVLREPDAVQWLDDDRFVSANEGDYEGGSRGFTIFKADGTVDYESGASFEHIVVRLGHYPEGRNKKGNEPEGVEVGTFGADRLIFVGSERGSLVGVYKDEGAGRAPTFLQALPGGIGPEGLLAIPARNLFVTASETDLRADGLIGSVVTIYERSDAPAAYPTLVSGDDASGLPIPWAAISGAAADPTVPGKLYVVTDSAFAEARILTIDATRSPAVITGAITVAKDGAPARLLDLEGIAVASGGGFWLASEGNPEREEDPTHSMLLRVDASGTVVEEIALPEPLRQVASRFGFEGVAVTGSGAGETVWLAVQREWKDDPAGKVKILTYRPANKQWGVVHYPLDPAGKGWIGLSEITSVGDGFVIVERDNQVGRDARVKQLTYVSVNDVAPAALGGSEIPVLDKTGLRDLLPDLAAPGGFVLDKVESFAIDADGNAFVITDNDGVDDHSGETQFLSLGKIDMPM
ncbi:MAG TPA: esterase-like activity of phytase family protein [Bauldia sp.]|nr:esterase-like activity of phytase family protein [Bauldia sp.]